MGLAFYLLLLLYFIFLLKPYKPCFKKLLRCSLWMVRYTNLKYKIWCMFKYKQTLWNHWVGSRYRTVSTIRNASSWLSMAYQSGSENRTWRSIKESGFLIIWLYPTIGRTEKVKIWRRKLRTVEKGILAVLKHWHGWVVRAWRKAWSWSQLQEWGHTGACGVAHRRYNGQLCSV